MREVPSCQPGTSSAHRRLLRVVQHAVKLLVVADGLGQPRAVKLALGLRQEAAAEAAAEAGAARGSIGGAGGEACCRSRGASKVQQEREWAGQGGTQGLAAALAPSCSPGAPVPLWVESVAGAAHRVVPGNVCVKVALRAARGAAVGGAAPNENVRRRSDGYGACAVRGEPLAGACLGAPPAMHPPTDQTFSCQSLLHTWHSISSPAHWLPAKREPVHCRRGTAAAAPPGA